MAGQAAVEAEPEVEAVAEAEQAPAGPAVEAEAAQVAAEQAEAGVEPVDWGRRLPAAAVRRRHKTGRRRRVGFHN